jgi:hypothetical protein
VKVLKCDLVEEIYVGGSFCFYTQNLMDCYTFTGRRLVRLFMNIWKRRSAQSFVYRVCRWRKEYSHDPLRSQTNTLLPSCIINGDESWMLEYSYETKCQGMEWRTNLSPRPRKFRMQKCIDLYKQGVNYKKFVPE